MGLFRYVVQGFGWELGRTAAREGIEAVADQESPSPILASQARQTHHAPPTKRELKAARKEARREAARKQVEVERKRSEIEAELQRLKKSR